VGLRRGSEDDDGGTREDDDDDETGPHGGDMGSAEGDVGGWSGAEQERVENESGDRSPEALRESLRDALRGQPTGTEWDGLGGGVADKDEAGRPYSFLFATESMSFTRLIWLTSLAPGS